VFIRPHHPSSTMHDISNATTKPCRHPITAALGISNPPNFPRWIQPLLIHGPERPPTFLNHPSTNRAQSVVRACSSQASQLQMGPLAGVIKPQSGRLFSNYCFGVTPSLLTVASTSRSLSIFLLSFYVNLCSFWFVRCLCVDVALLSFIDRLRSC
jgi:hypothetical protein